MLKVSALDNVDLLISGSNPILFLCKEARECILGSAEDFGVPKYCANFLAAQSMQLLEIRNLFCF